MLKVLNKMLVSVHIQGNLMPNGLLPLVPDMLFHSEYVQYDYVS